MRFERHLHIKLTRLRLTVGTDDAAKTAVLYGLVSQSVAYILEILSRVVNLKYTSDSDVQVNADFLSEKFAADVKIAISMRVWLLFDIALCAAYRYLVKK